jgi:hypothetical protein
LRIVCDAAPLSDGELKVRPMKALLDQVLIDDLTSFGNWHDAPKGTLILVKFRGVPFLGMRCQIVRASPMDLLLALEGEQKGQLLRDGNPGPALNVTSRFDLIVENPLGEEFTDEHWKKWGFVCEAKAGSGRLLVRANCEGHRLFVSLSDRAGESMRGEVIDENFTDLVAWGALGAVKKKEIATVLSANY